MAGSPQLGVVLRRYRAAAGFTLEELSEASGVSVRAISNMERSQSRGPQRKTIEYLADALKLADDDRDLLRTAAGAGRRRLFEAAPAILAIPRGVPDFAGRTNELSHLAALVDAPADGSAPVIIISGPPGVGKSSLALHAATVLADQYPDGQFFIDLRGLDDAPADPAVVLAKLIRAMMPDLRLAPSDGSERAGMYRTILAERRALIILDNAANESQVRPLLPAGGASLTLVTSRRLLTGLEGVARWPLAPLSPTEAVGLLSGVVGGEAGADTASLERLAELGGNLPLALRLIGNRLVSRPDWSPDRLIRRLTDEERRIEALAAGDLQIEAVFALSYEHLSDPARQLFRRLALLPGPDTGAAMAAALLGAPLATAEDALDELVEVGLVRPSLQARYSVHDLLRLYARARTYQEDPPDERRRIERHVQDWLLDVAVVAGRWFEPSYGQLPAGWDRRVPLSSTLQAEAWLRLEGDNWLAALRAAAAQQEWSRVVSVAEAMHWFSDRWINWGHWSEVFRLSSDAAQQLGDDRQAATHLSYQSWALNVCDGDAVRAVGSARQAFAAARRAGDVRQQGWARSYEAQAHLVLEDVAAALPAAEDAMRLLRRAADWEGVPMALNWVGRCLELLGRQDEALAIYRERIAIVTAPATAPSEWIAAATRLSSLTSIGRIQARRQDWAGAVETLLPSVDLAERVGMAAMQAMALAALGDALCHVKRIEEGRVRLLQAQRVYHEIGRTQDESATQITLDQHSPSEPLLRS